MKLSTKIKIGVPLVLTSIILAIYIFFAIPKIIVVGIVLLSSLLSSLCLIILIEKEKKLIKRKDDMESEFHQVFVNLSNENEKLSGELEQFFTDFDKYVISSKTDLFGRITYVSKAMQNIAGYTEKEMIGEPHNMIRHPDMPSSAFQQMWDFIEDDRIWSGEVKNLKKDGGCYWVRAIISPIFDNNGMKIGYNSIRQDITNEKGLSKGC